MFDATMEIVWDDSWKDRLSDLSINNCVEEQAFIYKYRCPKKMYTHYNMEY
jgi:hypothetical protein